MYRHLSVTQKEGRAWERGTPVDSSASYNDNRYFRCHNRCESKREDKRERKRGRKRREFVVLTPNRRLISLVYQTSGCRCSPKRNAKVRPFFCKSVVPFAKCRLNCHENCVIFPVQGRNEYLTNDHPFYLPLSVSRWVRLSEKYSNYNIFTKIICFFALWNSSTFDIFLKILSGMIERIKSLNNVSIMFKENYQTRNVSELQAKRIHRNRIEKNASTMERRCKFRFDDKRNDVTKISMLKVVVRRKWNKIRLTNTYSRLPHRERHYPS